METFCLHGDTTIYNFAVEIVIAVVVYEHVCLYCVRKKADINYMFCMEPIGLTLGEVFKSGFIRVPRLLLYANKCRCIYKICFYIFHMHAKYMQIYRFVCKLSSYLPCYSTSHKNKIDFLDQKKTEKKQKMWN